MKKPSEDLKRMATAIEDAEIAFWHVIADAYPEAIHGDFAPDAAFKMDAALKEAVTLWVYWNADPNDDEIDEPSKVTEIMLHRIEYLYFDNDMELTDSDQEHIAYNISQGFSEGELNTEVPDVLPTKMVRGYWSINNCPDASD